MTNEIKLKAEQFFRELEKLEEKYNAEICTGCGCCSAGYYLVFDGISTEINR